MVTSSNKFNKITIAIITLVLTLVIKHFGIPDDVNYVNNLYLRITGRKKTEPSRNVSNSGREK